MGKETDIQVHLITDQLLRTSHAVEDTKVGEGGGERGGRPCPEQHF